MKIEFLQILSKDGYPIFSKCFGKVCGNFYEDDVLLHKYLTSIKDLVVDDTEGAIKDFNGFQKIVKKLKTEQLIVIGVSDVKDQDHLMTDLDLMIKDINHIISLKWLNQNWKNLDNNGMIEFEEKVLTDVILPWFDKYADEDKCPKGDKCHFRQSLLPSLTSVENVSFDDKIWKRMNNTYHYLRKRDEESPFG